MISGLETTVGLNESYDGTHRLLESRAGRVVRRWRSRSIALGLAAQEHFRGKTGHDAWMKKSEIRRRRAILWGRKIKIR
jgi:hypothetical protein